MKGARIGQHELQPLPRWARLAFAARCIRRARALVAPPPEQARVLDSALARLEEATASGRAAEDELADAAASAYRLALDNIDARGGPDEDVMVATCMVAHAAAFALEAATLGNVTQATHLVAQSVDFAVHAHRLAGGGRADDALAAMRAHPVGADAATIGEIRDEPPGIVIINTSFGGNRIVDMLVGDPLPRIC